MNVFGKTKNFSFFLTKNLKKSNLLFLLNFVRMNQLKLVWLSKNADKWFNYSNDW